MIEIFAIYFPDDGYRLVSRAAAIQEARDAFKEIDGGEGWPEDILRLGVYRQEVTQEILDAGDYEDDDWKPVWTLRETPGSRQHAVDCAECGATGGKDGDDCDECYGYGQVCSPSGEPWSWSDEFAYIVGYEFPPEPADLSAPVQP